MSRGSKGQASQNLSLHIHANKPGTSPEEFKGKTVVVVGLCNSGSDACIELSGVAEKVVLSHRSGSRIVSQPGASECNIQLTSKATTMA
jgi:cation diffusion facilitator CzcD-associated flavoprotein CzcO